jgi:hypothetical protein
MIFIELFTHIPSFSKMANPGTALPFRIIPEQQKKILNLALHSSTGK